MISVCIPTYNGELFIKEQLSTILTQLGQNDEIIISDDSSTDSTLSIIEDFNDSRIRVLKNNNFKSPIFNLENALKNAKGDYIFLADQDDIWRQDKVKVMMSYLTRYNTVVSDCEIIDHEGNNIHKSFFKLNKSKPGFWNNLYKNSYLGCCMAFDKEILKWVLPFPKNVAMHDIWIGLVSEIKGKSIFIEEPLIGYRRHSNNLSTTSGPNNTTMFFKIQYRFQFIFNAAMRACRTKKTN